MSFLSIEDLGVAGLRTALETAAAVKADPETYASALEGRSIGLFFAQQSLRTWVSCDVAAIQLGAHPLAIRNDTAGLGTREHPADVGRVLARYLDLLAMRVHSHDDLLRVASSSDLPIVNLLSELEHPCQAVADLQTVAEARPIAGSVISYVGDGNNVCNSLMIGAAMLDAQVRVASPPGYEPEPSMLARAREYGDVSVTNDPRAGVAGADFVYTDVWASMGQESESELRRRHFAKFQVNQELFAAAGPSARFLHCLPAHRGEEVTDEVMEHPRSLVFDQAENRLHSFKAILLTLLG